MTPEEQRAYFKAYRQSHRDEIKAYRKVYYQAHRDQEKDQSKAYYQNHRDQRNAYEKAYHQAHRKERGIRNKARSARKRGAAVSAVDYEFIKARDGMRCQLCHKKVKPSDLSFDHIQPLSKGGAHTTANLQVTHLRCNLSRGPGRTPGKLRLDF